MDYLHLKPGAEIFGSVAGRPTVEGRLDPRQNRVTWAALQAWRGNWTRPSRQGGVRTADDIARGPVDRLHSCAAR